MSRHALFSCLLFCSSLGIACSKTTAPEDLKEKTAAPQTVVIATPADLSGVNELISSSQTLNTAIHYFALFMPLLEEQADYEKSAQTFKPGVAATHEFSPDRLLLTFKLRPDLLWSDGQPITADDVRFTWEAQTSPDVAWPFAEVKSKIKDVEIVDPLTVRFHFTQAYASQLLDANMGVILPKHAWGKLPFAEWRSSAQFFVDNLVVSGPYTLETWQPQQRLVLRKNPLFVDKALPKIERVVFDIIPDRANQISLLRNGKVDFLEFIQPEDAKPLAEDPNVVIESYSPRYFFFVGWNTSRPFLSERAVRQAMTLAIDRQAIVDNQFLGYAKIAASPFPANTWARDQALKPWPFDPERAKLLLKEHGFVDSDGDGILERDGKKFSIEILTNAENEIRKAIMVMVQEQLKKIGIEVRTRALEFNALNGPLTQHDFDGLVGGLAISTDFSLRAVYHSDAKDSFNWGLYSNPEVDRLIESADAKLDRLAAKPELDRIQQLIHEDQPMTFTYESLRLTASRRHLKNVRPNAISPFMNLREWELKEP